MFERFTDRARRVVVLAQDEARLLRHTYIGTEHLLLGLVHEGDGVAAHALKEMQISLSAVREEVEAVIGTGQQAPASHIPFTPRAKKVLELALREALGLGHNYIGTEHILLGLIREGEGVAAQVLVRLGADLDRVREKVIELLPPETAETARLSRLAGRTTSRKERRMFADLLARVAKAETRLSVAERRLGTGPDTSDLDSEIAGARQQKAIAVATQDFENAAILRDKEKGLVDARAAREQEWAEQHPDLPGLAEQMRKLTAEVERLAGLLRQHGIDPGE
jgi:hypothetical protein